VFNPQRVQTELEKAELHYKQAQTDHIYLTDSVLTEDEVRQSRFGSEYSIETVIDEAAYQDYKALSEQMAQAIANNETQNNTGKDSQSEGDQPPNATD
jgi:hypothetical protein